MFQGNWVCAGCGAPITQLPFEPKAGTSSLKCLDCFKKGKSDENGGVKSVPKPRFEGNWQCKNCGAAITSLPFDPKERTDNLKCLDCFKALKDQESI